MCFQGKFIWPVIHGHKGLIAWKKCKRQCGKIISWNGQIIKNYIANILSILSEEPFFPPKEALREASDRGTYSALAMTKKLGENERGGEMLLFILISVVYFKANVAPKLESHNHCWLNHETT